MTRIVGAKNDFVLHRCWLRPRDRKFGLTFKFLHSPAHALRPFRVSGLRVPGASCISDYNHVETLARTGAIVATESRLRHDQYEEPTRIWPNR